MFELSGARLRGPEGLRRLGFVRIAESDEFLTVAEVAAELKMNQQTIRNWNRWRLSTGDPHRPPRENQALRLRHASGGELHRQTTDDAAGVWDGDVPAPVAPGKDDRT